MKKIPKTQLKGILQIKPGWLAIATSGLFEDLKNKNLKGHEKEIVYITIESERKDKTDRQNKLFHKAINIYLRSNLYDHSQIIDVVKKQSGLEYALKQDIKYRFGVKHRIKEPKDLIGLREGKAYDFGSYIYYLISWGKFTLLEAREMIDQLLSEMAMKGIDIDAQRVEYHDLYKTEKKEVKKNDPKLPMF